DRSTELTTPASVSESVTTHPTDSTSDFETTLSSFSTTEPDLPTDSGVASETGTMFFPVSLAPLMSFGFNVILPTIAPETTTAMTDSDFESGSGAQTATAPVSVSTGVPQPPCIHTTTPRPYCPPDTASPKPSTTTPASLLSYPYPIQQLLSKLTPSPRVAFRHNVGNKYGSYIEGDVNNHIVIASARAATDSAKRKPHASNLSKLFELFKSPGSETTPSDDSDTTPGPGSETTPTEGSDTTPSDGSDTTPGPGSETTPTEGSDTTPSDGSDTTPGPGSDTTPGPGSETTPTEGSDTTPSDGSDTTTSPGSETTPTEGFETTPTDGSDTTPGPGSETTPTNGAETTPTDGSDTTPSPGSETTPTDGSGATPSDGSDTTPGPGSETTPADGSDTTPGPDSETTPTDGSDTTPSDGSNTTPGPGSETTPTDGSDNTPTDGSDTTPSDGSDTTPGPGFETTQTYGSLESETTTSEDRSTELTTPASVSESVTTHPTDSTSDFETTLSSFSTTEPDLPTDSGVASETGTMFFPVSLAPLMSFGFNVILPTIAPETTTAMTDSDFESGSGAQTATAPVSVSTGVTQPPCIHTTTPRPYCPPDTASPKPSTTTPASLLSYPYPIQQLLSKLTPSPRVAFRHNVGNKYGSYIEGDVNNHIVIASAGAATDSAKRKPHASNLSKLFELFKSRHSRKRQ
uniref:Uncharacterized protein n=1 Tax=Musca domestica TaxID=7370 RepID=A0A1I8N1C0_MUSDO